jgi:hypothetical protein
MVTVNGYYGSNSAPFNHDVYLSGLIGLNSVNFDSGGAIADSFDSTVGGYPATAASRARVLSNGTITLKGRVNGNVLSANGNVVLALGSVVTGDVTAKTTISGPGTPDWGRPRSALMTARCRSRAHAANPGSSISGALGHSTGDLPERAIMTLA